ncbi:RNA-directed DNA polymerase from mobile element jockey [Folsomia candida]|uniref:RNA-directed DNA polymerase from mobile element jockey n=1 Tax=Folsomia candida TaxID=158441 RepID=A0A226EQ69_FOLCA|nr:RNA-directed DNA polymerase from mobile element jockey [Folsomia candida]
MPSPRGSKSKAKPTPKRTRDDVVIEDQDMSDAESTSSNYTKLEIQELINSAINQTMLTFVKKIEEAIAPLTIITTKLQDLESKMHTLEAQVAKLESNSPSTPVPDRHEATKETMATLTATLLEMTTAMGITSFDFDEAFRVGKATAGKGPRSVIVKLLRSRDQGTLFAQKKQLYASKTGKFAQVYINEDMTKEERKTAGELRAKLRELKVTDPTTMGTIRKDILTTRKAGVVDKKYNLSAHDLSAFTNSAIVCLSETWHTQNPVVASLFPQLLLIEQKAIKPPVGRPKGGLILLLNLKFFTLISTLLTTDSAIIIEAKCSHTGALYVIGSFYFPPTREGELTLMDHLITLEEILEKHPNHHHILGGDFNARISSLGSLINLHSPCPQLRKSQDQISTPRGETVINFMTDNDLVCVNGRFEGDLSGEFTFVSKQGKSVIDLVFCSPTIAAVTHSCGTLSVPISHHHPYKLTWQGSSHQYQLPIPHIIKFSRKSGKYQAFQETLHTHCTALLASRSIAYPTLVNTITDVALSTGLARFYDSLSHIPHKPWYDKECHVSNRSVKICLHNAKRNNWDIHHTAAYVTSKHSYKALLRDKKRKQASRLKQQLNNALRQQDFWQAIKPFRSTPFVPNLITNEKWIEFYDTLMPPPPTHKESFIGVTHPDLDIPITMQELQRALSSLPVGKAPGTDGIPNELLKVLPTDALLVLLECDKLNPNNYRPIALLNSLLKLFTHIICHRLTKWANECHILPESQCGFRAGRGCDDQIFTLTSAITIGTRGKRASVFGLFIDFARAFPSIPHDKLWNKLHTIGVSGKIIRLLQSLYSNASTKIRLQDAYSSPIAITTGLLQGEILSPLLFSLYTCDIEEILSNLDVSGVKISPSLTIHLLMYADDTIVLSSTCDGLRMKIRALQKYFAQLSLNVHLAKTKVIVFRRNGGRLPKGTTFTYNGEPIEIVNQYTYLGVPFSSSGVFCKAAKHFKQKGLTALGATWSILTRSRLEAMQKKFNLFSALVTSTALYGAHLWGLRYLEEIEKTQYQFHRRLLSLPHGTPSYAMRLELNRPPLSIRVAHQTLRYLRKVMQHEEDRYTSQCLSTLQILVAEEPDDDMNWLNQIKSWIGPFAGDYDWSQNHLADLTSLIHHSTKAMTQAALEADITRTSLSQRFSYYSRLLADPPSQAPYVNLPIPLPALRIIAQCRLGQGRYSTPFGMIKLNYDEELSLVCLLGLLPPTRGRPTGAQPDAQAWSAAEIVDTAGDVMEGIGTFLHQIRTLWSDKANTTLRLPKYGDDHLWMEYLQMDVVDAFLSNKTFTLTEQKLKDDNLLLNLYAGSPLYPIPHPDFPHPSCGLPHQPIAATTTPQAPNSEQLQAQIRRLKRPRHEDDQPETSTLCQPPQLNMSFSTTAQVLGPRPFRVAPPDPPRPFSISSPNPFRC